MTTRLTTKVTSAPTCRECGRPLVSLHLWKCSIGKRLAGIDQGAADRAPVVVAKIGKRWQVVRGAVPVRDELHNADLGGYETLRGAQEAAREMNEATR